jgi:hypothetical protein
LLLSSLLSTWPSPYMAILGGLAIMEVFMSQAIVETFSH